MLKIGGVDSIKFAYSDGSVSKKFLTAEDHPGSTPFTIPVDTSARAFRGYNLQGYRRDYLTNRYVFVTVSPRARGLAVGINMAPDRRCTFSCVYCDVDRTASRTSSTLNLSILSQELTQTLSLAQRGALRKLPAYRAIPKELLQVRHIELSGEGEPSLSPQFADVVREVIHVRALMPGAAFKMVLMTNGTGLDLPSTRQGLKLFDRGDEIWIKLDAGSQARMNVINRANESLRKIVANIARIGSERPVVIASLFPCFQGAGPSSHDFQDYLSQLLLLRQQGVQIQGVQVYSAQQPTAHPECCHLPLPLLTQIAHTIQQHTGLPATVF